MMRRMAAHQKRSIWSWALYDWANSAFATTVMAGFFPLFFKQYWSADVPATESTFWLGVANSGASLIIVLLAPLLGAVADCGGSRKRFLGGFLIIGVAATATLFFIGQGAWELAALWYVVAAVGFAGTLVFYDALLVTVVGEERFDRVSALGFAVGYLGGGLLFALNVLMTLQPELFGLPDTATAVRVSFLTVALWWGLFSIPLFLWVHEGRPAHPVRPGAAVADGFHRLARTFREIRQLRATFLFLLAYWFYIDGVDTIIRMAVDYGLALGLPSEGLITALLITQFVGFPAALLFGYLGERIGPKTGIYIALAVYTGVVVWAGRMETITEFYLLAVVIGLVQGGIQSLSRSLYARLVPAERSAEFFGFFNIMGKFAAIFGPFLVGWTSAVSGEPRLSLLVLIVLFALGAFFLARVDVAAGSRAARGYRWSGAPPAA